MSAGRHDGGYFGEVQRHPFGVAAGQDERCALALGGADGAVEGRRGCALVLWR